jgi:uncharacterized damage-inducible protein DinB
MFTQDQFRILFDYHWHTTRRLLDSAAQLNDADYHENPGYGHGSIHDLFFHLLRTDLTWRLGLELGKQLAGIKIEDYPTLQSLKNGFVDEEKAWNALLETLTDEQIQGDLSLTNWRGETEAITRWRILQHLALHGMQHHSELARLLTFKGHPPGDLDFIFYGSRPGTL